MLLGKEQLEAIDKILDFINNSKDTSFSLVGPAGTGKTTIIKEIIKELDSKKYRYCLCAPTHKAKLVIEKATGREAFTLHNILCLKPNIEIFNLDFNNLLFTMGDYCNIPPYGIIICDESSMINDDLFNLLEDRAKKLHSKIIFIGDKAQLTPVKSRKISKVFELKNSYTLHKIYRQSEENALIPFLKELRENVLLDIETSIGMEGSIYRMKNLKDFVLQALKLTKEAVKYKNILKVKIAAYTNKRVQEYNNVMRKFLWRDSKLFHKHEILTSYETGYHLKQSIWNSMDYIITSDPEECDILIPALDISIPGYKFLVYDTIKQSTILFKVLNPELPEAYYSQLAIAIENLRQDAIKCVNQRYKKQLWKTYFEIMESFLTMKDLVYKDRIIKKKNLDYGYACTIHKLQGSTYENIFVDAQDICRAGIPSVVRQLLYVGLSRTSGDAYIII